MDTALLPAGIAIFFMNVGGRFTTLPLTEAQKKLFQHPMFTVLFLASIFYMATRSLVLAALLTAVVYLLMAVLLNESHPLNIYSQGWLVREGFAPDTPSAALLRRYHANVAKLRRLRSQDLKTAD